MLDKRTIKAIKQLTHIHNISKKAIYELSILNLELANRTYKIYDEVFEIRKKLLTDNNITMRDMEFFDKKKKDGQKDDNTTHEN
jgi:hypothetical protein